MTSLFSAVALAAPGEYWEITTKMEMPGMPFAMPATTQKVCIGKGEEKDPRKSSKDKDCEMTDVKTAGNKTSWKMRCTHDGEVMTGIGEQTTTANSYQGTMKMSGKNMTMNTSYSGKHVGGGCDTGEMAAKAKEYEARGKENAARMCDLSNYRTPNELIDPGSTMILSKDAPCADKKEQFCGLVRKGAPDDARMYDALVKHDRSDFPHKVEVANACGLNMAAATKSICKKIGDESFDTLSPYCPAEAKSWREAKRKRECEGRSYTSKQDLKSCIEGRGGRSYTSSAASPSTSPADNAAGAALEAAKKLKGRFGF